MSITQSDSDQSSSIDIKQNLLLDSLSEFYLKHPENMQKLVEIIEGPKSPSLRLIDWFVTNYSKKHNISYLLNDDATPTTQNEFFKVYLNYKSHVKSYNKKQFDPFNRTQKIKFFYESDKYIKTSICQLNFFRWAIKNKVIDYVVEHFEKIDKDMNDNLNYKKTSPKSTNRKPRTELSVSANKFLNKDNVMIRVKFDLK